MSKEKERELIKLKKEWYKKLKDRGFVDIEYFDNKMEPKDLLLGSSKFRQEQTTQTVEQEEEANLLYEGTYEYYARARALLHNITFIKEKDKIVWEMFSEGESLRKIGKQVGFSHPKVMSIIEKYKKLYKMVK